MKNLDNNLRTITEEARGFRLTNEKLDGQQKLLNEEYEVLQKSFEELSLKKQQEVELLAKEINSLILIDKESKQRVFVLEKELD